MLREPLLPTTRATRRRCLTSPVALVVAAVSTAGLFAVCLAAIERHVHQSNHVHLGVDFLLARLLLQDRRQHMREMSLPRSAEQPAPLVSAALVAAAEVDGSKLTPVVFLHGMGDASSNPGMQSMCRTASDMYPGLYVVCANVADGLASITTPIAEQVDELADLVKADARLANGFHAVGLSQGGLVLRGYVERHNDPPVRRLISVCTPHAGISSCPSSSLYKMVCPLWK